MSRHDASIGMTGGEGIQLAGTPFPWFDRESYSRILDVMLDYDLLPQSYDRWLQQAQRVLEKARRDGQRPIRAHIDPDRFLAWCTDNALPPDGMARLTYAGYVARLSLLPDDTGAHRVLPTGSAGSD